MTDNLPIRIYVKKIENRITFKIKTGYYLKILSPETMKLRGSTKHNTNKNENGENVSHLEITKVVLGHCNIISNDYQHDSKVFFIFFLNKLLGQLLDILLKNFINFKIFNSEILYIELWFTDQDSKPLEREDKININLVIN